MDQLRKARANGEDGPKTSEMEKASRGGIWPDETGTRGGPRRTARAESTPGKGGGGLINERSEGHRGHWTQAAIRVRVIGRGEGGVGVLNGTNPEAKIGGVDEKGI